MLDFEKSELEILDFWKKNKIFEKLKNKNKGKNRWSFLDGPITANNPMGIHHAWGRTYKDLFQRFKSMQGYELRHQNGFDCQGLWVEREEEKDLGLKNKKDIEKFGILKFVKACRKRVEKFSKKQTEQSIRLGYWMDWNNSYYTMSDINQLHNWLLIKNYFNRGWLYKGKDSVPWCWRCGTASSKHDIATEGYKEVNHKSLFMQFPIKNRSEYFLIFTTTPWTVPANVAIAVNANLDYAKVDNNGIKYWIAKSRLGELEGNYKILEIKKGNELEGIEYEMPYSDLQKTENNPKVVLWELASGEEGTGIVHIAPGCGAEDFELGKKLNLPKISPLDDLGYYQNGFEKFSLKKYSEVNEMVLKDLEERKFVYKIGNIRHRYPHCWRCGEELVFRLVDEWYVKCDEIRENLIKENRKINWYPEYGKHRQEEWFKNMSDWLISRKRYWGLPLPIWECKCGWYDVIGDLEELRKKAIDKKIVDKLPEIHRPWIDDIKIKCSKCGGEVSRISDVGDAWLDAGIVPFSTIGSYLENKKYWAKWFPADLISECIPGQFRGWFNALLWASVTLTGKSPFKSIFGYETLKDENGKEMHKSKGNAIWFDDAVSKVGADCIRLLYCLQDPSSELRFGFNVLKEPKNNLNILYNIKNLIKDSKKQKIDKIEDRWILSRLNNLIKNVTYEIGKLQVHIAMRLLQDFWLNDLSRKYIQIIRERLNDNDKNAIYTIREVYINLLKLSAPSIPFITENIWLNLRKNKIVKEESIHLCDWPLEKQKLIDVKLEDEMNLVFEIIERGLAERDKEKIGLKWPLAKAVVFIDKVVNKKLLNIICNQLNVKKIEIKKSKEFDVKLDTKINDELEAEGYAREISRKVQESRKRFGLVKSDKIKLCIIADSIKNLLEKKKKLINERVNSDETSFEKKEDYEHQFNDTVKGNEIKIFFSRIINNRN